MPFGRPWYRVQRCKLLVHGAPVSFVVGYDGPDRRGLDRLAVVDTMRSQRNLSKPSAFVEFNALRSNWLRVLEVGKLSLPIVALLMK